MTHRLWMSTLVAVFAVTVLVSSARPPASVSAHQADSPGTLSAAGPITAQDFRWEDLTSGRWVKESEFGDRLIVEFHPDGSLTEWRAREPARSWGGAWELEEGLLWVYVGPYRLLVFANPAGPLHWGVELSTDDPGRRIDFRFFRES